MTETPTRPAISEHRAAWPLPAVAAAAIGGGLVVCGVLAGRTGPPPAESLRVEAAWSLALAYAPALAWLLAAIGLGRLAGGLLPRSGPPLERRIVAAAMGVSLLMALDALLGRLGLLTAAGGGVAWAIVAILIVAALLRRRPHGDASDGDAVRWWAGLALAPALGTLLIASLAAPGWLWSSEFGGYDVLSYHLQLPREWFEAGAMAPLDHNAYSGLPSHVEAATLHLMAMLGDPLAAALPAQALQACLAMLAAAAVATLAKRTFGSVGALLAAGVFIGTPWTVVTGSLAYNEATVSLMLAAGLLTVMPSACDADWRDRNASDVRRRAIVVGILAAGAVGAKATSVALVGVPLGVMLLVWTPRVHLLAAAAVGAAVGLALLSPWLVHNTNSFGQPFFPLLVGALGGGGWSPTQIEVFNAAHGPPPGAGPSGGLVAMFDELLRHGIGPNPIPGEPWRPWWGLLWPFGLVAAVVAIASGGERRRIAVPLAATVGLMLAFWLCFTHWESRFLAPAAVPLALLVAAAWPWPTRAAARRAGLLSTTIVVAAWGLLPPAILLRERPLGEGEARVGAPAAATGRVDIVSGRYHQAALRNAALDREARAALLSTAPIWTFVNDPLLTGRGGRVLLVGESRGFYLDRSAEYSSVWNRGRLSELVRVSPGDPDAWRRALREAEISLVILDEPMIERWRGDGWWDPALDAEAIDAFRTILQPLQRFPSGLELFAVRERTGDPPSEENAR